MENMRLHVMQIEDEQRFFEDLRGDNYFFPARSRSKRGYIKLDCYV